MAGFFDFLGSSLNQGVDLISDIFPDISAGDVASVAIPGLISGGGAFLSNQNTQENLLEREQLQQLGLDRRQQESLAFDREQLAFSRESLAANLKAAAEGRALQKKSKKADLLQSAFFKLMQASQGGRAAEASSLTNLTSAVQAPLLRR